MCAYSRSERTAGWSARRRRGDGRRVWGVLGSARARASGAVNRVRNASGRLRRRRGGAHPTVSGGVPAHRDALARPRRRRGARRAGGAIATFTGTTRIRSRFTRSPTWTTGPTRMAEGDSRDRRQPGGPVRPVRRHHHRVGRVGLGETSVVIVSLTARTPSPRARTRSTS